jgi:hypothetical protein
LSQSRIPAYGLRRQFRPGDKVPETGIYEARHADGEEPSSSVHLRDETFLPCPDCAEEVRYFLLRKAPYIFSDDDFQP